MIGVAKLFLFLNVLLRLLPGGRTQWGGRNSISIDTRNSYSSSFGTPRSIGRIGKPRRSRLLSPMTMIQSHPNSPEYRSAFTTTSKAAGRDHYQTTTCSKKNSRLLLGGLACMGDGRMNDMHKCHQAGVLLKRGGRGGEGGARGIRIPHRWLRGGGSDVNSQRYTSKAFASGSSAGDREVNDDADDMGQGAATGGADAARYSAAAADDDDDYADGNSADVKSPPPRPSRAAAELKKKKDESLTPHVEEQLLRQMRFNLRDYAKMLAGKDALKVELDHAFRLADEMAEKKWSYKIRRDGKRVGGVGCNNNNNNGSSMDDDDDIQGRVAAAATGGERGRRGRLKEPPSPETFPPFNQKSYFRYELIHRSKKPGSRARVGRIHTPHGIIDTPGFVPVGTNAALKAVDNDQSRNAGTQLMFCNTYHLIVHPGANVVEKAGGLHRFMNRSGPIITDSGGFQVFSLADATSEDGDELKSRGNKRSTGSLLKVSENGVLFRSYFDGSKISLTPEESVRAQKMLGADIIVPLDELPPYHVTTERLKESVYLSHRWEARSLQEHLKNPQKQAMYAVIHGGVDRELRKLSVEYLSSLPFDGFAVGGSLGKDRKEMAELLQYVMPLLPEDRPNHVLGIADTESIESTVAFGCDTFDSAYPTRVARHGTLFTTDGIIHIKLSRFKEDYNRIDPKLETIPYSRSYLHHLLRAKEPLFLTLASLHNMIYMNKMMANIREKILRDEI